MNRKQKKRVRKVTDRYKVLFRNPYRIDDIYDYEYAQERYERRLTHYQHKIKKDTFREGVRTIIKKWKNERK